MEVKDFGVGIPETDKRRIFDPFYTGENGRKFRESTGMGLYLLKEALNILGHRIEAGIRKLAKGQPFNYFFRNPKHYKLVR